MPDYKAILDARVERGELVLRAPGVYAFPKPAPVQTHIPVSELPPPPMQGEMPAARAPLAKSVKERYKRFGLKPTPAATFKARGCSGVVQRVPLPPKAPKPLPPVQRGEGWEQLQQAAAAMGQVDPDKFADSATRMRAQVLALKAKQKKLQRTDKKPLETQKAKQAASRAPAAWEKRRL